MSFCGKIIVSSLSALTACLAIGSWPVPPMGVVLWIRLKSNQKVVVYTCDIWATIAPVDMFCQASHYHISQADNITKEKTDG